MEDEGELIATALVNEFDRQEEKVQELFEDDDDAVALLERLRELKPTTEQFSPEDLSWADSCLVTDQELLDESWVSLKQTLLDRITEFAASCEENNAAGLDDGVAGNGEQMQVDEKVEERLVNNGEDVAHVQAQIGGLADNHDDEIESKESIFRLWDIQGEEEENELINELKKAAAVLKVAEEEEEDEFITQLKRAVAESDLRYEAELPSDEPSTMVDEKLDELISSMGDLSLRPSSK